VIGGVGAGFDGEYSISVVSSNSFTYADSNATGTVTNSGSATADSGALAGPQRSMVDSIVYTFNQAVNLTSSSFTIAVATNDSNAGVVPTLDVWSPDGGITWIVTFSGSGVVGNSIATGAYNITLNLSQVTAASSGLAGTGSRTDSFFRAYGDINGDGYVNTGDSFQFKKALTTYNPAFDYNDDGFVNTGDSFQFKKALTGPNFGDFTQTLLY
jgi:hypothetical protein